jgi:sialate O-acetylesterase
MKKLWLYLISAAFVFTGCRLDSVSPVKNKVTTNTGSSFSVSSLFQNNMVIQRDQPVAIWGQAPTGTTVTVSVSWKASALQTVADNSGNWKVLIPASPANANPQTITLKAPDATTVVFSNVLLGDVWICSGQSNMVMPMDSIPPFDGVTNYQQEIAAANYPAIRLLTVQEDNEAAPLTKLTTSVPWQVCSPAVAGSFSAVAYYFAKQLNTTLNVPIGIIVSAVDGSYCQDWTNVEAIQNNSELSAPYLAGSSQLYNGMINPLINLTIKGFTWYQGEQNEHDSPVSNYTVLNAALIAGWRSKFSQPELPFYYVQITPFLVDYSTTSPPGSDTTADDLAFFREVQANIRGIITGTGMAVTMDVGDPANHHPPDKKPVGQRLAYLALNHTYGQNIPSVGPQFASWTASGNEATVSFVSGTATGLTAAGNAPLKQYFFVSGPDQVWREGQAVISGSTVVITAPSATPLPIIAIRYAFTDCPITYLQNSAGLPAEPFRTDSWTK